MIIPIEKKHVKKIAELDMVCREGEFLPKLGLKFIALLYGTLINMKGSIGYVFIEENEIAGFVIGVSNSKGLFTRVILRNGLNIAACLIKQVIKDISIMKNILETFLYPLRESKIPIAAELLVIGVDNKFRNRGIGSELVRKLNSYFKSHGITTYKVTVTQNNLNANEFYTGLGFKYKYNFSQYGRIWNLYAYEF